MTLFRTLPKLNQFIYWLRWSFHINPSIQAHVLEILWQKKKKNISPKAKDTVASIYLISSRLFCLGTSVFRHCSTLASPPLKSPGAGKEIIINQKYYLEKVLIVKSQGYKHTGMNKQVVFIPSRFARVQVDPSQDQFKLLNLQDAYFQAHVATEQRCFLKLF